MEDDDSSSGCHAASAVQQAGDRGRVWLPNPPPVPPTGPNPTRGVLLPSPRSLVSVSSHVTSHISTDRYPWRCVSHPLPFRHQASDRYQAEDESSQPKSWNSAASAAAGRSRFFRAALTLRPAWAAKSHSLLAHRTAPHRSHDKTTAIDRRETTRWGTGKTAGRQGLGFHGESGEDVEERGRRREGEREAEIDRYIDR